MLGYAQAYLPVIASILFYKDAHNFISSFRDAFVT